MEIPHKVHEWRGAQFLGYDRTRTQGDRTYGLIDQKTGNVASAKNPRKWGKLFDFRAVFIDPPQLAENIPPVRITFPDGTNISPTRTILNPLCQKFLGETLDL